MKKDLSFNEIIHEMKKRWKANNMLLAKAEIEEPRLKLYRVRFTEKEEVEYDEDWKKFTKVQELVSNKEYDRFGWKICLCEYMQDYRDKIPQYNKEYLKRTWIPLYDDSWELIRLHKRKIWLVL